MKHILLALAIFCTSAFAANYSGQTVTATTGTSLLKADGAGGFSNATRADIPGLTTSDAPTFAGGTETGTLVMTSTATAGFNAYNTVDAVTNYQDFTGRWSGGTYYLSTLFGGSASAAPLAIGASGSAGSLANKTLGFSGSAPYFTFNFSTSGAISGGGLLIQGTFSNSSSLTCPIATSFTYNQSSGGGSVDFKMVRVETSLGSGVAYFMQGLAGASGTTEKWRIANTGASYWAGGIQVGSTGTAVSSIRFTSATLIGGTITVLDSTITANSRVMPFVVTPSGAVGAHFCSAKTAGVSYVITSTSATDTSVLSVMIIEP